MYPCIEQFPERVTIKDQEGNRRQTIRKKNFDVFLIVTPAHLLILRIETKNRNTGKLNGFATMHAIEKVKHGLDEPE